MNKFRSAILSGKGALPGNPLVSEKAPRGSSADDLSSIGIERNEIRNADHREGDRHRLPAEQAQARYRGKTHSVELVNLSSGGAMIAAAFTPYLWERVDLLLGEGQGLECAVRWVRHDRVGLEFAHETTIEVPAEQRNALLLQVIQKSFPSAEIDAGTPEAVEAPEPKKETAVDTARRAELRHPLIWLGKLYHNHDTHEVRLRNIGANGALVDQAPVLEPGATLMLDLGNGVQMLGEVAWSRGVQAGLRFIEPFDMTRLADAVPKVTGADWQRPTFLDQRADEGDPWAQGWGRKPIEELRAALEGFLKR